MDLQRLAPAGSTPELTSRVWLGVKVPRTLEPEDQRDHGRVAGIESFLWSPKGHASSRRRRIQALARHCPFSHDASTLPHLRVQTARSLTDTRGVDPHPATGHPRDDSKKTQLDERPPAHSSTNFGGVLTFSARQKGREYRWTTRLSVTITNATLKESRGPRISRKCISFTSPSRGGLRARLPVCFSTLAVGRDTWLTTSSPFASVTSVSISASQPSPWPAHEFRLRAS